MGILDSLLGAAAQLSAQNTTHATDGSGDAPPAALIDSLTELISRQDGTGGLDGLAQRFGQAGLGDALESWIGRGANAPVTGAQMQGVLGGDFISAIAAKLGIDPQTAAALVAQWLPRLIDAFTPNGRLPAQQQVGEDADLLSAAAGALLQPRN